MLKNKNQKQFFLIFAKVLAISGFIIAVFLLAQITFAGTLDLGLQYAAETGLGVFDIRIMIARIIRIALGVLGILAVIIIIYAGFLYMTSQGDKDKALKARKIIINAVIGLIIILSAYSIASFIINSLIEATTGRQYGAGAPYGAAGGALGGGIIESHYPARNAVGVARNTSIVITFKEAMLVETLIADTNSSNILGDCVDKNTNGQYEIGECDLINKDNIKIRKASDSATAGPFVEAVKATQTPDNKIFVFKPLAPLGSPDEKIWYEVFLSPNLKKHTGQGAFGNFGSYTWQFEVGTELDLTPPKITSVLPLPAGSDETVPKNSVVQINFNEAINPITLMGIAKTVGGTTGILESNAFNFINVKLAGQNTYVAGQFTPANQYQTVEFLTLDPCGINSCGEAIYCLPGNKNLEVIAKAADLDDPALPTASFPYTGIVDMADNSLDGNRNNTAVGPISDYNLNSPNIENGDNLKWSFWTNDTIDLVPPKVDSYLPTAGNAGTDPRDLVEAVFDKLMMASTVKPNSGYGDGYCQCSKSDNSECPGQGESCSLTKGYCVDSKFERVICTPTIPCGGSQECTQKEYVTLNQPAPPSGYWLFSRNISDNSKTRISVDHVEFQKNSLYNVRLGSGLKDLHQNCFQPAGGPGCIPQEISPGQYTSSTEWTIDPNTDKVTFPTCDLTSIDITSFGRLLLSYTGANNKNVVQPFSSYSSLSKNYAEIYNYNIDAGTIEPNGLIAPFDKMWGPRKSIMFIYHNRGDYYLFIINSITGGAGQSGRAQFSFDGMPAGASFVLQDDLSKGYPVNFQGSVDWNWGATLTDGGVIKIDQDTALWTITINPIGFENIDNLIFYYPGGSVSLPKDKPFTISVTQ